MRRFLLLAAVLLSASACGDHILGPVQTVDGTWSGQHSGFSITFVLTESDTTVFGTATVAGVGGVATTNVTGTFKYPNLDVQLSGGDIGTGEPAEYTATLSQTQAKLDGFFNGAGFNNLAFELIKK